MGNDIIHIKSISEAHRLLNLGKPKHPQISIFSHTAEMSAATSEMQMISDLYFIAFKAGIHGAFGYGRNQYDFEEGAMVFFSPGQLIVTPQTTTLDYDGWILLFHPDLIRTSELASHIEDYSFFSYEMNEALHISEEERTNLKQLIDKISTEINQNIDKHTQTVITTNIELLLQYCHRYYDRQFYTRENLNKGISAKFDDFLKSYFSADKQLDHGIPSVKYCAEQLAISPNYLSDLLKKDTGRSAQDHIHAYIIEKAKSALLKSDQAISQIAYQLGFEYSQHFSKIFKSKTGETPSEYRSRSH